MPAEAPWTSKLSAHWRDGTIWLAWTPPGCAGSSSSSSGCVGGQGLTSIWVRVGRHVDDQPGPTVLVDQAGDQARPGLGKMRATPPLQNLARSGLVLPVAWQVLLAGPWTGWHGWRAGRQLDGSDGGRDGHEEDEAGGSLGGQAFPLAGGVEIGRTRQREVWPLTSMASNYSPSRGHPESPHTK